MEPNDPKKSGDPKDGDPKTTEGVITVEVDGEKKEFNAEGVKNLVAQQAGVTQKAQKIAAITDAAAKYGLEPEDYVENSEGAFGALNKLMDAGIIDEKGNLIEKGEKVVPDPTKVVPDPTKAIPVDQVQEIVAKATKGLKDQIGKLEKDQTGLMKMNLHRTVKDKHDSLSDSDVSSLFDIAVKDQKKDIWQHAEDMVEAKKVDATAMRKTYAKEFKIDLEKWDENKLHEQDADGGAAMVLGGKTVSFKRPGKDGKTVTPRQATLAFFKQQDLK